MPRYTGPVEIGDGARLYLDQGAIPEAWAEDPLTSRLGGRWISSGFCIRKTWPDIGPAGENWPQSTLNTTLAQMTGVGPWNRHALIVTSAHIWCNVGGTGTFDIGCGTDNPSPVALNIINHTTLAAGVEHNLAWSTVFDPSFERGRLVSNAAGYQILRLRWNGTSLTTGPTGAVSISVFGVVVPDPDASDS